jgi:maltooligosyltrehalose trehalohydrolase
MKGPERGSEAVIPAAEMKYMRIGAYYQRGRCEFTVWTPFRNTVQVKIVSPRELIVALEADERSYWRATVEDVLPGTRYYYRLDGERDRPDPASHFQPDGVHGPSEVVDHAVFTWEDGEWKGVPLTDFILYEIHVGAFTQEGTFDAVMAQLNYLNELGITAVELMPLAQFPGPRNWGYDGVYPYAVQNSYGGPEGLKRLVNACHQKGVAVVLDVVYNHLGPEGNYLWDFGPYFTDRYRTPWGQAINFDGAYSDEVRRYFIGNALHWIREYHIDALRIDAIHGIFDLSAKHFLQELGEAVHIEAETLGRNVYVIPESDLNDVRVINPKEIGGYGLDAQWNDDFHHALHTLLTGERSGYYRDFGTIGYLEKAFREGFVYSGQYSEYRKRSHGSSSKERPAHQFVVFSQNHDQVGNRMLGERLSSMDSFERLKLVAGAVLFSPYIPLLFMGEEYGETAPFQYFVSHFDAGLIEAVRKGRMEEFASFGWQGAVPDPQDEHTFLRSKINLGLRHAGEHKTLLDFYTVLLKLRKSLPALSMPGKDTLDVIRYDRELSLFLRRRYGESDVLILLAFDAVRQSPVVRIPQGKWVKILDSTSPVWGGAGDLTARSVVSRDEDVVLHLNPHSVVLYEKSQEEQ